MNVNNDSGARRVAMLVANPAQSPQTGWPVGFWWSEVSHPFAEFAEAGYEVEFFSPQGGKVEADGFSDPEHESGYSADDFVSLGFKKSTKHASRLEDTKPLADLDAAQFDAVFLCGGQSPMVTFIDNEGLHKKFAEFYESGKIAAAICHGTCVLLKTKTSDGKLLVEGKTWTGFADAEAKKLAMQLADDAGFVCYDFGGDADVPLLEEMCRIWVHLSQKTFGRDFAFKVLRREK